MENKVEKAIDDFVKTPQTEEEKEKAKTKAKDKNVKKVVLEERDGLIIERIDKVLVTKDGKQLLREWY
jgi:hypothetical protein